MEITIISHTPEVTESIGMSIGALLVPGNCLVLDGPLGGGKTCFVRGIASGMGCDPMHVRSPTFVIHHVYKGMNCNLHHLDLYRLGEQCSLDEFDLDELLEDDIVVIEWGALGKFDSTIDRIQVTFAIEDPMTRRITLPATLALIPSLAALEHAI